MPKSVVIKGFKVVTRSEHIEELLRNVAQNSQNGCFKFSKFSTCYKGVVCL